MIQIAQHFVKKDRFIKENDFLLKFIFYIFENYKILSFPLNHLFAQRQIDFFVI